MRYLIDTNIVVDYLRKRRELDPIWLVEGCAISVITQAELFYGAERSADPQKSFLEIEKTLKDMKADVIVVDENTTKLWAQERVRLERAGTRIEDFDLLIAATALSLDLELVTGNVRHFDRVKGLKIVDSN